MKEKSLKVIFLDIDGVLNSSETIDRNRDYPELDPRNLKVLKQIVDVTDAKLVLISEWKDDWTNADGTESKAQFYIRYQLQEKDLDIFACTQDQGSGRGKGIRKWISAHCPIEWCILDDHIFPDYESCGLLDHLVKTDYTTGGLREDHIKEIHKKLSGEKDDHSRNMYFQKEDEIFHVHTNRCGHAGNEADDEYVEKALTLGADRIVFTDHAPFPGDPFVNCMKMNHLSEYCLSTKPLKVKCQGRIEV